MSLPESSIFRNALQVSPERIAAMRDDDLNVLMINLLRVQAYKCQSSLSEVRVNTEDKAKDDGCDGWTAKPGTTDDWLGSGDTCWQLKAGTAGEPSKLKGEVLKPIPKETLEKGGQFFVVTSGSTNGKKGENDRLKTLVEEAVASGVPTVNIRVLGSERLAVWCNQHPAVAARWANRPSGLWTLVDWVNAEVHQAPWQASDVVKSEIESKRLELDFDGGTVHHLHIYGKPGVGKTRFALELCREAAWCGTVIYIQQAADVRLQELIDSAAIEVGVRLMVVADEVQPEDLKSLRDSIGRSNGRIRLITVGHCPTPDPTRIPALEVQPLDKQRASAVVNGWFPAMPTEHVDFVVRFADGYVRLAWLAANAVARSTAIDVRGLLGREEIRGFLDGMLGTGDRRPLHVVAVLSSVGWTEDRQSEGEAVAKHLGLDWTHVRVNVEEFHRKFNIAPRGGRYRYISPIPLGIHLAVEAWTAYPDILRTLPTVLTSEGSNDAYYERLQSIASNPQAREFAREELSSFFQLADFVDARAVRRWSALSAADPDQAARNLLRALKESRAEDREKIEDRARREMVWTLVRLAWRSTSFTDSVKALALLGEAENETWSNNATGEFKARFQVFLGGTAVPYLYRLEVLDELLIENRPAITRLVVNALAKIGEQRASITDSRPVSDELPEKEWHPLTNRDYFECIKAAIGRLTALAGQAIPEVQEELVAAAKNISMMLRDTAVRPLVVGFFKALKSAYPDVREALRRVIADIISMERKYRKELSPQDIEELEGLHSNFEDMSLDARLRQHVGQNFLDLDEQPNLKPLAEELLESPEIMRKEWSWLTSGDAGNGWMLGQELANADSTRMLADILPSLPGAGRDLRVLCGYIYTCRKILGNEWYDSWIDSQLHREPKPITLFFSITWRCGATVSIAHHLVEVLKNETIDSATIGQLTFGSWGKDLPLELLEEILWAMHTSGHAETAVAILDHRIKDAPEEVTKWQTLALELVKTPSLIRSRQMTSYHWKELAIGLVKRHPGDIASAIFKEQGSRSYGTWFAEYSSASEVLNACVEEDSGAVWSAILPWLTAGSDTFLFRIGFPKGILDRVPATEVMAWIDENPKDRATTIAGLIDKDFSSDETIASRIIGSYGDIEEVADSFFSSLLSGSWSGSAFEHWSELASKVENAAPITRLPKLRLWAINFGRNLREMAERDRHRDEERQIRRF